MVLEKLSGRAPAVLAPQSEVLGCWFPHGGACSTGLLWGPRETVMGECWEWQGPVSVLPCLGLGIDLGLSS